MAITPKNWASFQHYKDRAPIWIKLHRALLDNYDFHCLPVASRALAPLLWLLASEYEGGHITLSLTAMAFRIHHSEAELAQAIKPLIDGGFFVDDSNTLAADYQVAMPEKRREQERDREEKKRATRAYASRKKGAKPKCEFPDDWIPNDLQSAEASEFDRFRDSARAHARKYADWPAAWRNWKTSPYQQGASHGALRPHPGLAESPITAARKRILARVADGEDRNDPVSLSQSRLSQPGSIHDAGGDQPADGPKGDHRIRECAGNGDPEAPAMAANPGGDRGGVRSGNGLAPEDQALFSNETSDESTTAGIPGFRRPG